MFNVFAAKRAAELAPGVGTATEIRVISRNGVEALSGEQIENLDRILLEDVKPRESTSEALGRLKGDGGPQNA